ncbi:hypothetical protein ABB37_07110 [Leptomonas pyrrhocoris]|uniref:Choline transporter-like protein n=1 Tax=Leptomonas pyrrhocoris TaxID=157538 RepID=A0A0M9FVZ4_LEPPY|nr:hypothetical protein ABB37_07110 [Leptomonas pyrrhocoris]KPA77195.1 hypothetical protein ABB37_07110 [Leptomonas pyrrhocoris]|eukprot:XP_015655634.1 hypothetical protein ABB37_07110 [Leptomonas pyrrhocoris]
MPSPAQRPQESVPLRTINLSEVHGDPYAEELGIGAPIYDAWALDDDEASSKHGTDTSEPIKLMGDTENSPSTRQPNGRHGPRHTFHTPGGRPCSNELWRFRARGCQDCWAALFFIALVTVVLLWGAAQIWQLELTDVDLAVIAGQAEPEGPVRYGPRTLPQDKKPPLRHVAALRAGVAALWERQNALLSGNSAPARTSPRLSIGSAVGMLVVLVFAVTTTVLVAYAGLLIISLYPRQLIFMQSTASSVFFAISAGVALARGSPLGALLFTILTFMPLLWIYLIQDRIPFTATMLCATVAVLRRHKSLFAISLCSVLVCWSMLVVFILCVMPSVLRLASGWVMGKDIIYPFMVVFAFFWVQEVVNAVVHVTVCGVVATWYFAGEEHLPLAPVTMALQRAVTTSFGSVCFGSLVTAVVSFVHSIIDCVRSGNDQNSFVMCLMDCMVGCIEDLVRYFNEYAFVHVAIYGCSYVDAAKETWGLVKQCVFSAVFNDCLASQVVAIMTLMSAVLVAVFTGIVTWSAPAVTVMFVMAWVVCSIFYSPIASCVTTIFVCFAEVPVGLQLSFPQLYDALVDADAGYTARREDASNSYGTYVV